MRISDWSSDVCSSDLSGLADVLDQDFVRTARAKGLSPAVILRRHALRPALMPGVSYLGPAAAGLLTGAVVIETVFSLPGLGRYFVQGALNRDSPLLLGVVGLYAALIILFNLIADLISGWLVSRVRTGQGRASCRERVCQYV